MQSMRRAKKSNPARISIIFCYSAYDYAILSLLIWARMFDSDFIPVTSEVDLLAPALLVELAAADLLVLVLLLDSV